MDKKTVGVVFVKSRDGKANELNECVANLLRESTTNPEPSFQFVSAITTVGPYDCIIRVRGAQAESISDFVLRRLRMKYKDLIADTQTFVGWPIGEKV